MITKQINIQDVPSRFSELLDWIRTGAEVLLLEDNQPIARLAPMAESASPRTPGLHEGTVRMSDDFDAPLPDAFWMGQE